MAIYEHPATAKLTVPQLRAAVAKDLQMAIRMEAAATHTGVCKCVTCGKRDHYKKMNAGHFVPGRTQNVLFVEDNINIQCPHCNRDLSGNLTSYTPWMVKHYGQSRVDELYKLRNEKTTFDREQLLTMRAGYKARIKTQKQRLEGNPPSRCLCQAIGLDSCAICE